MSRFVKAVEGMGHSVIYTDDSGNNFRFYGGTWAWRNHNPGNVYPVRIPVETNSNSSLKANNDSDNIRTAIPIYPNSSPSHRCIIC